MEITLSISSLILIVIGSVGVIVALSMSTVLFIRQSSLRKSNMILAFLLLFSGLTLLNETLTTSGITNRFKNLYFIPIFYSLSIAPLFYLFIKSKYLQSISKLDLLHLLLPTFQAIVYLVIGFKSVEFKNQLWIDSSFKTYLLIESILFPVGLVIYSYLLTSILKTPSSKAHFWNEDLHRWLLSLTKSFIILAILESIVLVGEYLLGYRFASLFYILRITIFTSFILWIAYNVIKLLFPSSIYKTPPQKASTSFSDKEANEIKLAIVSLMEEDKIYLNPDLSLGMLSNYAGTTQKKCSQVLRNELNRNFNQFINAYRIEAFKKKLLEGKHKNITLLSIAYESGFDSKSTFNRSFKLITGLSPTQYLKNLEK